MKKVDPSKGYIASDGKFYPWYDLNKYILSRNIPIAFDIGSRGIGKTTSWAEWAMKSWRKTGAKWAITVRRPDEQNLMKHTFWQGMYGDGYDFLCEKEFCHIREQKPYDVPEKVWSRKHPWSMFGYFLCLSDAVKYKQMSAMFSNPKSAPDKMMFDEWLIEDTSARKYLDEPFALMSVISSVFRNNPRRVCCFSNAGYITNPYFSAYGITSGDFDHSHYVKAKNAPGVVFHKTDQPSPAVYSMGLTTKDASYQVGNEFRDKSGAQVMKRPAGARPIYILTDGTHLFKVYDILIHGWLYIESCHKVPNSMKYSVYLMEPTQSYPNAMCDKVILNSIKNVQAAGKLRFSSDDVRNDIFSAIF